MNRWTVLALLCIAGIWALAVFGLSEDSVDVVAQPTDSYIPWKNMSGSIELISEPTSPMSYFVADGNTIDLGYEAHRWKRVLFIDDKGNLIGDFTKASDITTSCAAYHGKGFPICPVCKDTAEAKTPQHTKRYIDGSTELWCGDIRTHSCGGSANFDVPECIECGMYVCTTGISPETDRIYETEAYGHGPSDGIDSDPNCTHPNIDDSTATCAVYHGEGVPACPFCPYCWEYVSEDLE